MRHDDDLSVEHTVWVSPSATVFSSLCETCLEEARLEGMLFADALATARVSGELALATQALVAQCRRGHRIVLRRVERPGPLRTRDRAQLELV